MTILYIRCSDNPGSDPERDWFRYQSIQGEVACLVVRIHRGLWHKFEERWRKGTLPMTEEGRPLCLTDSPKTIP